MRKEIPLFVSGNQTSRIESIRLSQIRTEWIIIVTERRVRAITTLTKGGDSRDDAIRVH